MSYRKPDIDGLVALRLATADLALKFTDDPKRPLALVAGAIEVPLFMESADELWRLLSSFTRRVVRAGQASGVCVFADHPSSCQCRSALVSVTLKEPGRMP